MPVGWDVETVVVALPGIAVPVVGEDLPGDEGEKTVEVQDLEEPLGPIAQGRLGRLAQPPQVAAVIGPGPGVLLEGIGDILEEPAVVEVSEFLPSTGKWRFRNRESYPSLTT